MRDYKRATEVLVFQVEELRAENERLQVEAVEDHTNMSLLVNKLYQENERLRGALAMIEQGVIDRVRSATGNVTREQMQDIARRTLEDQ